MNILIANRWEFRPGAGGVERVSHLLADELRRAGHDVWFVAAKHSKGAYYELPEQSMLPQEATLEAFVRIVTEKRIDVVLNQSGRWMDFSKLCIEVKQRTGVGLVTALHFSPDVLIRASLSGRIRAARHSRKLYRMIYDGSDRTVLLSERYKAMFERIVGRGRLDRLIAIPNPCPFGKQEPTAKEKLVLWVGRMERGQKRPDRMLRIWARISEVHPEWNLIMLGDGPMLGWLRRRSARIKRVSLPGFADPTEYYRRASVVCMTSAFEGLPMTLIEAVRFGVVPVAFDSFESLGDVVDDGVDGLRILPFDMTEYASRLSALLGDEDMLERMAASAVRKAEKFAPEKITARWVEVFEKMIKRRYE